MKKNKFDFEKINGLFLILVVVMFSAFFLYPMSVNTQNLKRENAQIKERIELVKKEISNEEQRKSELEQLRVYMTTEQYKSEVAKEKLGLVYPDEILIKPAQ